MGNVCEYTDENKVESFKFSKKKDSKFNMRGNLSDMSLSRYSEYRSKNYNQLKVKK